MRRAHLGSATQRVASITVLACNAHRCEYLLPHPPLLPGLNGLVSSEKMASVSQISDIIDTVTATSLANIAGLVPGDFDGQTVVARRTFIFAQVGHVS